MPAEFDTVFVVTFVPVLRMLTSAPTTICPLGPSAVSPIIALRNYFREEVNQHVELGGCPLAGVEAHA